MNRNRLACLLLAALVTASVACHDIHLDFTRGTGGEIVLFDDLYSVSVVDDKHAVAVGYYGAVYFTADGGDSWSQGSTNTLISLYSVDMGDKDRGWAVGQRGLILRTEDGGRSWNRQANLKEEEGTHLFAVTAIDGMNALAIGEWGTRITTSDGGKTWVDESFMVDVDHPQFVWLSPDEQERVRKGEAVYEDVTLNDVYCLGSPSKSCWLIGEFGYIFYSEDEGKTWQPSAIEGSVVIEPMTVPYNTLEVLESDKPGLRRFAAGIINDLHLNVAIESYASDAEIRRFGDPDDPTELFEIIEARSQDVRSTIEAAGIDSARMRLRGQPPWDFEDYLDDDPEFLQRYLASRRADTGGMRVRVIQNPILFSVRFRDENHGLIAGLGGVVLRTDDGGRHWSYSKIDRKQALFGVGQLDSGRSIAVGEKGLVRVSPDWGKTWQEPHPGEFPEMFTFMRDVAFDPSGRIGFIVGQTGQVLRSRDAGLEWKTVLPPPEEDEKADVAMN
jgi:photosystem II stability/assembly factor-like uncharacterized protein